MAQITSSVTFIPSAYDGGTFTTNTTYPTSNGLSNTSSTTYARFTMSTTSQYAIYNFDTSDIPSNATINSITCQAKISYSGSNITTKTIQLYAGSTAKGSASTINVSGTSNVTLTNITPGTWTAQELQNAKLRINGQKGNGNNRYIMFYGATLTVNYTYTLYDVTATSDSDGITVSPLTQSIVASNDAVVTLNNVTDVSKIIVKDNGVDVTNSLVAQQGSGFTLNPSSYSATSTSYTTDIANAYYGTSHTSSYASLMGAQNTRYYTILYFDIPQIPEYAQNITVSCGVRNRTTGTGSSYIGYADLRAGMIGKGSQITLNSTATNGGVVNFSNTGTWDVDELETLNLYITHPYGGSNRYVYIYGVDLTITYTAPQGVYTYTISNVQADHVVTVEDVKTKGIYLKMANTFVESTSFYKRGTSAWSLIDYTAIYCKVNGNWITGHTMTGKTAMFFDRTYVLDDCVVNFDGIDSYNNRYEDTTSGFEGDIVYPFGMSGNFMRDVDVVADGKSFEFNGTTSYMRPSASADFDKFLYNTHTIEVCFEASSFDLSEGGAFTLFVGRNSKATVAMYAYYYQGNMYFIRSCYTSTKMLVVPALSTNQIYYIAANNNGWLFNGVYYSDADLTTSTNSVGTNDMEIVTGNGGPWACASIGMRFKDGKDPQALTGKIYAMRIHSSLLTESDMRKNMSCDFSRFS